MTTDEQMLAECNNCGLAGRVWPTPFGQDLCAGCWEEWFNKDDEAETTMQARWVLQCPCGGVVKGMAIEAACTCGRVYVCMQIY